MSEDISVLSSEEIQVVKMAAAQRFHDLNIRPDTAAYVFERFTAKQARSVLPTPAANPKAVKIAETLGAKIAETRAAKKTSS